ncbi:MAG TPA: hypothetical protein DCY20_05880 [Firmicutes bacterium]|nr:hypothetical protein [Bacillota bacterium]
MKSLIITRKYQFLFFIFIIGLFSSGTLYVTNQLLAQKNTCKIIITQNDHQHIKELKQIYPDCKIIQKENLYKYDMINKLLHILK